MEKEDDYELDDSSTPGGGTENTFLRRKNNDSYRGEHVYNKT